MPTCANNIVGPQILHFQSRYLIVLHRCRQTPVRPTQSVGDDMMLRDIWDAGQLSLVAKSKGGERSSEGWRAMGLYGEQDSRIDTEADLFRETGKLGLECLVSLHY
jgi:engulfment/cell motility protein 1